MRILILGGTAFLGRAIASDALVRGHSVTCAARGTSPTPAGAAFVRIERDDERGLTPLAGEAFDAIVDVSRTPRHVERAVRDLDADHWVFVSTTNVYARFDVPEQREDAELLDELEDLDDPDDYGRAKVTCERLVRGASATATVVRPGLIAGPGDDTSRSGYYPWRFAHPTGHDVLAPAGPDFPTAMIDVDDLAAWIVDAAERRLDGVFNATGPTTTLGEVVRLAAAASGSTAAPRWVDPADLAAHGIAPWMGARSLPLWIDDPDWRWFATLDTTAARTEGLVTRPLAETLARSLAYEAARPHSLDGDASRAGLSDGEERDLRAALEGAA
ncbi:NAD-dependent epimerase/dehydratase family protein [Demequina sp. NBRC 110057]|uniref:NAD-dependent epimerase/dehydratase family protein n=1 Tax=Demequina sp. NBRC 110057 TaxID=1570346 RepID=UPI000A03511B|nr:NAD-dependent epimerase/dehydratase family protein [Demequina sp. NBRC 110057]